MFHLISKKNGHKYVWQHVHTTYTKKYGCHFSKSFIYYNYIQKFPTTNFHEKVFIGSSLQQLVIWLTLQLEAQRHLEPWYRRTRL